MTDQAPVVSDAPAEARPQPAEQRDVSSFLLGAAAGGLAGVAAALLLTGPVRTLVGAIARRVGRDEGGDLRFELLLQ